MTLSPELIYQVFPLCHKPLVQELIPYLNEYLPAFGIDSKLEICHFLAQAGHETDSFKVLVEYASGNAYEYNLELGNVLKGDGPKFKGHGIFMTTGRKNHQLAGQQLAALPVFGQDRKIFDHDAVLDNPLLLAEPRWAVASACIYWKEKGLSAFCVADTQLVTLRRLIKGQWVNYACSPIEAITRRINGGMNGFQERKRYYLTLKDAIQ